MSCIARRSNAIVDRQKQKVYTWEWKYFGNLDKSRVPFDQTQMIVNYVWEQEGLKFPPTVEPLPKQIKKHLADATRVVVRFPEFVPTFVILHELSHSMTSLHDGWSNLHGALFMGIYCKLAAKHLRLNIEEVYASAQAAGLEVDRTAIPVFWSEQ